jgi:hypothetical protein
MKFFSLTALVLFFLGCSSDFAIRDMRNGVVRSETRGSVGYFDGEITTDDKSNAMADCMADIGDMAGKERQICEDKVRADMERERRILDMYANPYMYY